MNDDFSKFRDKLKRLREMIPTKEEIDEREAKLQEERDRRRVVDREKANIESNTLIFRAVLAVFCCGCIVLISMASLSVRGKQRSAPAIKTASFLSTLR